MIDWDRFALALFSTLIALGVIVSWTVLIICGESANVPPIYATILPSTVTVGLLGAGIVQARK